MCLTQDDFGAAIRTSHGFCPLFDVDDLYNGFLFIFLFGISQCNRGACNEWQHGYEVPMSVYLPIRDVHWGQLHGVACAPLATYDQRIFTATRVYLHKDSPYSVLRKSGFAAPAVRRSYQHQQVWQRMTGFGFLSCFIPSDRVSSL